MLTPMARRSSMQSFAVVCLVLLFLLSAASAWAASTTPAFLARFFSLRSTEIRFRKGPTGEFHLVVPGGYKVYVSAGGNSVSLGVDNGQAFSSYSTRGVVSPHRIKAHFADLGDISVHFKASGRVSRRTFSFPGCRTATRFTYRRGAFSGEIRFAGENGYLGLDAHHARGAFVSQETVKCHHVRGHRHHRHRTRHHHRPELKTPVLWATSKSPQTGATRSFSIESASMPRGEDVAFVFLDERVASVDIARMAFGLFPSSSFVFDNALSSAQVTLLTPFSGTGSFVRNPDGSSTWTGSLSVSFPGADSVSLAGSEWQAHLAWHRPAGEFALIIVSHSK